MIEKGARLRVDRFGKLPTNEAILNNHNHIYELMKNADIGIENSFKDIDNHPRK